MEPSLLERSMVRQLRRVSLRSSQDQRIAITVQRGNAAIMIQDAARMRGQRWPRRRRQGQVKPAAVAARQTLSASVRCWTIAPPPGLADSSA